MYVHLTSTLSNPNYARPESNSGMKSWRLVACVHGQEAHARGREEEALRRTVGAMAPEGSTARTSLYVASIYLYVASIYLYVASISLYVASISLYVASIYPYVASIYLSVSPTSVNSELTELRFCYVARHYCCNHNSFMSFISDSLDRCSPY
jgi:hypothetical protein